MYSFQKSKAVSIIGSITVIAGFAVIIGWYLNLPGLQTFYPHYVSMRFNTALCFVLLGGALLLTQFQIKNYSGTAFVFLSAFVTLFATVTLLQDIFHFNAGIDQLFIRDRLAFADKYPLPGRMASNVSVCFTLAGLALLGFIVKNRFIHIISQYLFHLVTAISAVAIIGYLYGVSLFYTLTYSGSMAINTAILFFITSIAATLLHPSLGITGLFTGQLIGNKMARRIFIMTVFMVIIFGSLRLQSQRFHFFSFEIGISLLALSFLLVSLAIIWHTATWLNKIDVKRYAAEEEIKVMNAGLEKRVEERSAELMDLLGKYRESESKFRAAFEYSPLGLVLTSIEGNRWLKVNKRFCDMVGYPEQELLFMTSADITHPDDMDLHHNVRGSALKGESGEHRLVKRYVRKDGSYVWVCINMVAVRDDKANPLYFVAQIEDISERKKAEEDQKKIIENEERLRAIFDNVEGATCLLDKDLRLVLFNKVFQETNVLLTGKEPGIGDEAYIYFNEKEKKERYEVLKKVLTGSKQTIEADFLRNGRRLYYRTSFNPVIVNNQVVAISCYSLDLTASKEAENNIRKTDARFRAIVESVFVGINLNDADWRIIYRSPSMQAMNGWTNEEMDQDFYKLVHPDDVERVKERREEVMLNPGKSFSITYRIRHKEDYYIWIESLLCNKLSDPDLAAIIVVTREITDRKQVEAELHDAELKFRTLAEKSMVGVYISQNERFIYVNPRFAEIFGYQPYEIINTTESAVDIIIAEQDRDLVRNNVQARYRGEMDNIHYEVRGKKKDGTINYIEFYGSRVMIDSKPSIIGTMLDNTERKVAEEVILREKTLSDTIINSLPEVFYLRNDKGKFLRWNKNFEKVMGYSHDEIKELDSREQLAKEDMDNVRAAVEKMHQDGVATVEARVVSKNGTKTPFLITITPLIYENQQCVLGLAVDISARLKAEEELRSSEQKYKLLFEHNPLPLSMIARDDLSIIAVNEAIAKLYGYTREDLLHQNATVFRLEEDLELQKQIFAKDLNFTNDIGVIRHVKKDGTIIFVHISANDIIFEGRSVRLSLVNDVTEKIMAEETLQKSEANLKTIMDTTDTAYALLDKKLNVMAFNQMAVKFVDSHSDHPHSNKLELADYFPKEKIPEFVRHADEVLNGSNTSYEINYPQPDGSVLWYYVRLFPIKNRKNEIFGLMLALSDITERKNAEESLKTAYERIQDHINSIKDMAWKQSHIIRSPVANLKGLATLLKDDPSDIEVLGHLEHELNRMDAIIIEMAEDASKQDL